MSAQRLTAAVFCGSSMGASPVYAEAARAIGAGIAARGWAMTYGGASVGLMGVVADAALAGGAEVVGALTRSLEAREVAHTGLTRLHLVDGMDERKALMLQPADVVVVLPGGLGTLDEAFEAWAGVQIGAWRKPVGFVSTQGFYDPLEAFVKQADAEGFIRPESTAAAVFDPDPHQVLDRLAALVGEETAP